MDASDPRAALMRLAEERGESLAALSRMVRRNPAYLQQYARRGSPRVLPEAERRLLADHFGVAESVLGGPADAGGEVTVPYLAVEASAGGGRVTDGEAKRRDVRLERSLLRETGVAPAHASIIDACGDSMLPGIVDGDRLVVDGADRRIGAGLFVIAHDGALLVKRLRMAGDMVAIVSDNPAHPMLLVPADTVAIKGRVKLLIRRPT